MNRVNHSGGLYSEAGAASTPTPPRRSLAATSSNGTVLSQSRGSIGAPRLPPSSCISCVSLTRPAPRTGSSFRFNHRPTWDPLAEFVTAPGPVGLFWRERVTQRLCRGDPEGRLFTLAWLPTTAEAGSQIGVVLTSRRRMPPHDPGEMARSSPARGG